MHVAVPGGLAFAPDELALLRRAFDIATSGGAGLLHAPLARDVMARGLFADYAAGERDVARLAHEARLRLVKSLAPGPALTARRVDAA